MKKIFLLVALLTSLFAQNDYDVGVMYGRADAHNFGEIISGNIAPHSSGTSVIMVDAGYKIVDNLLDYPFDIYVKAGIAKFSENGYDNDVYENTLYLKGYYSFNFLDNCIRLGMAEGASYTYGTLYVEKLDALQKPDGNNSHYLNYLEVSLDLDFGKLVKYESFKNTYVGVELKHRSGIFGLINNVKHGGSNYDGFYVEKNF